MLLIILENKDNLTPENIGNWIRTKAVGFGFGDGYPAELTGSTALVGNFGAADGNLYVVSDTALTVLNGSAKEMFSARHSYNDPAVSEASGRYLLYNAGGHGLPCGDVLRHGDFRHERQQYHDRRHLRFRQICAGGAALGLRLRAARI